MDFEYSSSNKEEQSISKLASYSLVALKRISSKGMRKYPPSSNEMTCIKVVLYIRYSI